VGRTIWACPEASLLLFLMVVDGGRGLRGLGCGGVLLDKETSSGLFSEKRRRVTAISIFKWAVQRPAMWHSAILLWPIRTGGISNLHSAPHLIEIGLPNLAG
jgi:hypothetical protein